VVSFLQIIETSDQKEGEYGVTNEKANREIDCVLSEKISVNRNDRNKANHFQ
jgi:hypothetical protein